MINVPDTVGFAEPDQFGELIYKLNDRIKNVNPDVLLSVHCHNDLGMATANTLAAIKNGADKVECTINGIGERAGNAALEEVVMAIQTRSDVYNVHTNINTKEIMNTSKIVSSLMGLEVQVNKAITGDNAFAHSSGIHQDGLLKSRDAYEIIDPKDVGLNDMELVLTARSGRHAVKNYLEKLGFDNLSHDDFENVFADFLTLADEKKEVQHHDLYVIVKNYFAKRNIENKNIVDYNNNFFILEDLQVVSNTTFPSASIKMKKGKELFEASAVGNGPIDALYTAMANIIQLDMTLLEYKISSVTRGKEALGKVKLEVEYNGKEFVANATDTDVIKASALAYINVANNIIVEELLSKTNKVEA